MLARLMKNKGVVNINKWLAMRPWTAGNAALSVSLVMRKHRPRAQTSTASGRGGRDVAPSSGPIVCKSLVPGPLLAFQKSGGRLLSRVASAVRQMNHLCHHRLGYNHVTPQLPSILPTLLLLLPLPDRAQGPHYLERATTAPPSGTSALSEFLTVALQPGLSFPH